MKKITKIAVATGITVAAMAMYPAQAHADTVGQVAHEVCARLYADPSVPNFQGIVDELLVRYTEESENQIMHAAMHDTCPEFRPLAIEALLDRVDQMKPGVTAPVPQSPPSGPISGGIGGRIY